MTSFAPIGQEEPMSTLCRMVINTRYEDLPPNVIKRAKHSIFDTMAVTVGGSSMDGIPAVVGLVKDKGGKPESIIPFYGGKVPASEAGLAIGPMSRAMDLGEVHEEAGHCSEYIVPTLLAATGLKNRVTGKEFITAFVVGQEVLIRIGIAYKLISKAAPSGLSGGYFIFGCVAAVGKLLGLSQEELENAEGIARGMTQPHDLAMYRSGTLTQRVHHGFVSQDAINACLLAKRGVTGPRREVLLAPWGYLGFAKWETNPAALTEGLGEKWEMTNVMMKPYSSCKNTHTAIAGLLDQMKEHNFTVKDIAKVDVDVCALNWAVVSEPKAVKWNPQSVTECQFSLPYTVSIAALDGDVFLDSFQPQKRARQDVHDLMNKISTRPEPGLPPFAARVTTTTKDGRKFSKEYLYVKGHPKAPLTEAELIQKFKKCVPYSACKLSDTVVDSVINALLTLEDLDDVVAALLVPLEPK